MAEKLNRKTLKLAMMKLYGRQSKVFDRSVRRAAKVFPLPADFFHFLTIDITQYYALRPCLKRQ